MKKKVCGLAAALMLSGTAVAGETGHYVNGIEGIKAATVPGQGFYYRLYNVHYPSDTLVDRNGNNTGLNFDVDVYAMAHRFIYVTDYQILGGSYFFDAVIPFTTADVKIDDFAVDNSESGLGDINIEPFGIAWHGTGYDLAFAASLFLPTGDYDLAKPASPGKDFMTGMLTFGGTLYSDNKSWSYSILSRYEIHGEKDKQDITPGDDFHFEWGVAKRLENQWEVGLTGYAQWQVTDDSGSDVPVGTASIHDRVWAVGPEAVKMITEYNLLLSLRYQSEFSAVDRTEGDMFTFTLTKIF